MKISINTTFALALMLASTSVHAAAIPHPIIADFTTTLEDRRSIASWFEHLGKTIKHTTIGCGTPEEDFFLYFHSSRIPGKINTATMIPSRHTRNIEIPSSDSKAGFSTGEQGRGQDKRAVTRQIDTDTDTEMPSHRERGIESSWSFNPHRVHPNPHKPIEQFPRSQEIADTTDPSNHRTRNLNYTGAPTRSLESIDHDGNVQTRDEEPEKTHISGGNDTRKREKTKSSWGNPTGRTGGHNHTR